MKLHALTILTAIAVPTATARADDDTARAATRAALDAQLAAISDRDPVAFGKTFLADDGDDPRAVCILPTDDATAAGTDAITERMRGWPKGGWEPFAVALVRDPVIDVAADTAHVTADLRIDFRERARVHTTDHGGKKVYVVEPARVMTIDARYTGLFVRAGGTMRAAAVMISTPAGGKPRSVAFAGYPGAGGKLASLLDEPRALAASFDAADPNAVVVGIQAWERATGADATKLLAGWSKRRLVIIGDPDERDGGGWGFAAATVSQRVGPKYQVIMTALVITRAALTTKRKKGWLVTSAHFAVPFRFPPP